MKGYIKKLLRESLLKEVDSGINADVGMLLGLDTATKDKIKALDIPVKSSGVEMTMLPDDKLHVTLTSIRSFKPFRADFKDFQLSDDIKIPKVILGHGKFVYRPEQDKVTYVLAIDNQDELKDFVDKLYASKGLENPEPDRFFHITVANNAGGNPFKSIGNVIKQDLMEGTESTDIQVWFDLDGVLADMKGSLKKNVELQELRKDLDDTINQEFTDYIGLNDDEIKAKFKAELAENPDNEDIKRLKKIFKNYNKKVFKVAGKEGFYGNLDLIDGAIELVKFAHKVSGKKPNILSSPVGNENNPNNPSVKEKREWVQMHFGGLVDHVEITTDKARVVKDENDILIDDRAKYVNVFKDAGGSAILFKDSKSAANELEKLVLSLKSVKENKPYIKKLLKDKLRDTTIKN